MTDPRPYEERPAARPVPSASPPALSAPAPKRGLGCGWILAIVAAGATVLAGFAIASMNASSVANFTANSADPSDVDFGPKTIKPGSITDGCDAAGKQAVIDNQAIYDREGAVSDEIYADGTVTAEENARYLEVSAEGDAAYLAALAPMFESCSTAAEWIGVVQKYPDVAGLTDGIAVSDDTLQIYCREFLSSNVCVDAVAQGIEMLPAPT